MIRLLMIAAGLALVAVAAWSANGWMQDQAWMRYTADGWDLAASGWGLLLRAWPVALAGVGIGAALVWPLGIWIGGQAAEADISKRESAVAALKAEYAAQSASKVQEATTATIRASERMVAAERLSAEAEQRQVQARALMSQAQALAAKSDARIANADRRRRNATGAAGRMRSKLKRISESDALADRPKSAHVPR